jgi:hypothetical protein
MNLPKNLDRSDYISIFNKIEEILLSEIKENKKGDLLNFIKNNTFTPLDPYDVVNNACEFFEDFYFAKYFENENYPSRVLEVENFINSFTKHETGL